jgi:succinate dehydrogenase/fumarate reductase flavoprotein subunit
MGRVELLREESIEWDYVTDVLVLGYGGAGACAAVAAKDGGAEVIILEKAPFGGGNTACSVGNMLLPDNVAEAIAYYRALSFDTVSDQDLIRTMAEAMAALPERLKEWGIDLKLRKKNTPSFPTLPGARCIDHWSAGLGESLFNSLSDLVTHRHIKILFESPAKTILKDPETGNVRGVLAEQGGERIFLKAQRGIVLATGGYENNFEMQGYFHFPGLKLYPFGTPYNTGDGVKMASEIGADQWHFASTEWFGPALKEPTEKTGVAIAFRRSTGSFLFVNRFGKNFINESMYFPHRKESLAFTHFDHERAEYSNIPFYAVFDEKFRRGGPLYGLKHSKVGYASWQNLDEWSQDNTTEIEKGWITQGGSIRELAEKLGLDSNGLQETIEQYNRDSKGGKINAFGRLSKHMAPIEEPPFYGVELCLSIINTQGGPKHNSRAQALDMEGKPIPRLYKAGELGSFFGHLYQGGSNLPEALAFGRMAGEQAALETIW